MSAGAYGFVMASNYNSRPLPAEALVQGESFSLIRRRQTMEDLVRRKCERCSVLPPAHDPDHNHDPSGTDTPQPKIKIRGTCRAFIPSINTAPDIAMKRLLPILAFLGLVLAPQAPAAPATGEYIIVIGGPSLMKWEKYKGEAAHDHWWANFVRAGRIRTEQIRAQAGPDAPITWLVYRKGYVDAPSKTGRICSATSTPCARNII